MSESLPPSRGPLDGLRVVELAGLGPAPYCAMLMADLGADVIRINRPPEAIEDNPAKVDVMLRGRRSMVVDLKHPRGADVVLALVEQADVFIEGFRPGVTERLGIGPEECDLRNPALIYARVTGWGRSGPWAQMAGHDINYVAVAGALNSIGKPGGSPVPPINLVGDFGAGGMFLLTGILAALWERTQSGVGQIVDATIVDGTMLLASSIYDRISADAWTDERGSNLIDGGAPFYDVYETADQRYMAVGALEPRFFKQFCAVLGVNYSGDQYDRSGWPQLRTLIATHFAKRTRADWTGIFEGTDACVAPVMSFTEALTHPQIAARGSLVDNAGRIQPAPGPWFSRTRLGPVRPPATDGADVFRDWTITDGVTLLACGAVTVRPNGDQRLTSFPAGTTTN